MLFGWLNLPRTPQATSSLWLLPQASPSTGRTPTERKRRRELINWQKRCQIVLHPRKCAWTLWKTVWGLCRGVKWLWCRFGSRLLNIQSPHRCLQWLKPAVESNHENVCGLNKAKYLYCTACTNKHSRTGGYFCSCFVFWVVCRHSFSASVSLTIFSKQSDILGEGGAKTQTRAVEAGLII